MNEPKTVEEMWDMLNELGVSEQTLQALSNINGYNVETMESLLYWFTGNRTFEQLAYEMEVS